MDEANPPIPRFQLAQDLWREVVADEFDLATGDPADLEIQEGNGSTGFHYFYDRARSRLVKHFVLHRGAQVETMCSVTLIKKEEGYSPRFRFWKRRVSRGGSSFDQEPLDTSLSVLVKASVDAKDGAEVLWKLIEFLRPLRGLQLDADAFRVAPAEQADLLESLQNHDKAEVLVAVRTYLGSDLTEADVQMLVDRKRTLEQFARLLNEKDFLVAERSRLGATGPEGVWQKFFEANTWIFGYGLNLIACESFSEEALEARTTGNNVFSGAGKRVDAVMRTRGFIQSLLFAEIKHAGTDLLAASPYRPPDVYLPSKELTGAVSQIQKTVYKAVKKLEDLHRKHDPGGSFEFEVSTVRPAQVVVIGNLQQLADGIDINVEKLTSFELFRRSQQGVEVVTFDELYERARFIAASTDGSMR